MNVSSLSAVHSLPTMSICGGSKSAVEGITEGLSKEVGPLGIRVTNVEPAGYGTSFIASANQPAHPMEEYAGAYEAMADLPRTPTGGTSNG